MNYIGFAFLALSLYEANLICLRPSFEIKEVGAWYNSEEGGAEVNPFSTEHGRAVQTKANVEKTALVEIAAHFNRIKTRCTTARERTSTVHIGKTSAIVLIFFKSKK